MANSLPLLFLDIDGVLLRRRQPGLLDSFELASGCLEFLEWAASRFQWGLYILLPLIFAL